MGTGNHALKPFLALPIDQRDDWGPLSIWLGRNAIDQWPEAHRLLNPQMMVKTRSWNHGEMIGLVVGK
jgi:hypothetical protein